MENRLYIDILPQPNSTTCGPTCLHAIYRYFNDPISLPEVISEVKVIEGGGTLAVYLANHALRRGYKATIYTYNLQIFDPTWFTEDKPLILKKLELQLQYKKDAPYLRAATLAFIEYLELGGELKSVVLTAGIIRKFLKRSIPILTGLSATYLYDCPRELAEGDVLIYDDIRGESTGHFVVLAGYDRNRQSVLVSDPLMPNPVSPSRQYEVNIYRLVCSIMLGILTYDCNLLIIQPARKK
ncbi:MAG: peptidase-C39 like family protein [Candidatus Heimdallarchaeota archaeon]